MAAADVQSAPGEPGAGQGSAPAIPDYLASPNAVFGDKGVQWRYGTPPDYSKTRKVWEEGKSMSHVAGSLPQLVENLVKNWEVEASFKPRLEDWRTIDHENYTFAINGGPPQSAEHMLKVGTYNAIITSNEYYDPANSDFASSHKTFKRMMPTFAWEVIEVYSGPPTVAFKWRHWGTMKNDYVGFNDKGEKITAKAHGGQIDIQGVTVATVDDNVRLRSVNTWFDPLEMFRQIAPDGIVQREAMNRNVDKSSAMENSPNHDGVQIAAEHNAGGSLAGEPAPQDLLPPHISNTTGYPADAFVPHQGADTTTTAAKQKSANSSNGHGSESAQQIVAAAEKEGASLDVDHSTPTLDASACPFLSQHGSATQQMPQPRPAMHSLEQTVSEATPARRQNGNGLNARGDDNNETMGIIADKPADSYLDESRALGTYDAIDAHLESGADNVHPNPKDVEHIAQPDTGEAVAAAPNSQETKATMKEMSSITAGEAPFLLNRE